MGERQASGRRAIVTVSVGDRPWLSRNLPTFERYGERHGIDICVERQLPSPAELLLPALSDDIGRKSKAAYAAKLFFPWKYLTRHGYDRVAVLDDTCCIRPSAPDIFAATPYGSCGFTTTSRKAALSSFRFIRDLDRRHGLRTVGLDYDSYMNGGVITYDVTMAEHINPDVIMRTSPLLMAKYPVQTVLYYIFMTSGIRRFQLPKGFNSVPASSLPRSERKRVRDVSSLLGDAYIFHVTSYFEHRQRIIEQLSEICMAEWRAASAHGH